MAGVTALQLRMEGSSVEDATSKHVVAVSGAALSTTQFKYGSKSLYFDGTDDFVEVPAHDDFNFEAGDFTIEFWLYPTSLTGLRFCFYHGPVQAWWIYLSDNYVRCAWSLTGSDSSEIIASSPLSLNAWSHVAFVREGSVLTLYLNGNSRATGSITGSLYSSAGPVSIGKYQTMLFSGYMDDVRITKGAALYSGSAASPIPLSDSFEGVVRGSVLLNGVPVSRRVAAFNRSTGELVGATVSDPSGAYSIATPNREEEVYVVAFAEASGSEGDPLLNYVKFLFEPTTEIVEHFGLETTLHGSIGLVSGITTGKAINFNVGYIQTEASDLLNFGSGDWTLDFWVRVKEHNTYATIIGSRHSSFQDGCIALMMYGGNKQLTFIKRNSTGTLNLIYSTSTFEIGDWHHVAVTHLFGRFILFVDGVIESDYTLPDLVDFSSWVGAFIGTNGWDGSNGYFKGDIASLRFTSGRARYCTPFDVPASPVPKVGAMNAKIFDYMTPEAA